MSTEVESGETSQSSSKLEPGNWQGEYIDVNGYRGRLSINLETEGGELRGSYELTLRTEDQPTTLKGTVEGKVDAEGGVSMNLALGGKAGDDNGDKSGDTRPTLEYNARTSSAGSYARQALFGVVSGSPDENFGGGVWIAWRFNKPANEGR